MNEVDREDEIRLDFEYESRATNENPKLILERALALYASPFAGVTSPKITESAKITAKSGGRERRNEVDEVDEKRRKKKKQKKKEKQKKKKKMRKEGRANGAKAPSVARS